MPPVRKTISPVAIGAVIAVIVAGVFAAVPSFDFLHYDDALHVWQDPHIVHLTGLSIAFFWTHEYEQLYIPLSYMLFALLAAISGQHSPSISDTGSLFNPHIFHSASVLLHIANTLIVFAILRRLTKADIASAAGALLFGLHPLQVESVAWISELRGLLGSFFVLASIHAYLHSANRNRTICITALILFILALLSKPSVAAVPIMMFILDRWVLGRPLDKALKFVAPYLIVALPFVMIAHHVQHIPADALSPLWSRPLIALDSLSFYIGKLVAPVDLAPIYGRTPAFVLAHRTLLYAWIVPAVLAVVAWALRKRFPAFGIAFALVVVAMLPTSGIVPFAFQAISTTADRYFYLSMFGVAYLATVLLAQYRTLIPIAVACIVLVASAGLTTVQTAVWQNTLTLFTYAANINPTSSLVYLDLGNGLRDHSKVNEAIGAYQKAAQLDPRDYRGPLNACILLTSIGDDKDALSEIIIVNKLKPNNAKIILRMADIYSAVGDNADAIAAYKRSLALAPDSGAAYNNLGIAYLALHEQQMAVDAFKQALALQPSNQGFAGNLADALKSGHAR